MSHSIFGANHVSCNYKMVVLQIQNLLTNEEIDEILNLPEVATAKTQIDAKLRGSVYFYVTLTSSIKSRIFELFGINLVNVAAIPMRWIKGDTPIHSDTGISSFENTYLTYLTNSEGELIINGESYPIVKGYGYSFPENLPHATTNTGDMPRLLLGPMSEQGFAVGAASSFNYSGGTTVFIRQNGNQQEYSTDQTSWNTITSWPVYIYNTNTSAGLLKIEFMGDTNFDTNLGGVNIYFICGSSHIQFGSTSLNTDGSRPIITINDVLNYPGFIANGDSMSSGMNNVYIVNLEIRPSGTTTLASGGGWFGQRFYGKTTTPGTNHIINCHSTGNISIESGGIVGKEAGPIKIVNCSSSGSIDQDGGGIVGSDSPSSDTLYCESCWSTGTIGTYGGGITGSMTKTAEITKCYSNGIIQANAGGMSGRYTGGIGNYYVENCYSTGTISERAGGIVGSDTGDVTISNCYSLGTINVGAGGIIGTIPVGNSTSKVITNCYSVGTTSGSDGYIIVGRTEETGMLTIGTGTIIMTNNYSEAKHSNSGWNDTNAYNYLNGVPSPILGMKWIKIASNQPYEIKNIGHTPYRRTNITAGDPPAIVRTDTLSFYVGSFSIPAIVSGRSYTILEKSGGDSLSYGTITIHSNTGIISCSSSTTPGTYTLTIRNTGSYHITTVTVIISPVPIQTFFTLTNLFTNNAQVYYKSHGLAGGGVGTVKNCRHKMRKT